MHTRLYPSRLNPSLLYLGKLCWVFMVCGGWMATALSAAETGVKFDAKADFSTYSTYSWVLDTEKPTDSPLAPGAEIDTEIRNVIDEQLRDLGFEQAVDQDPDFLVSYDGALLSVLDLESERRQITEGVAWVVDGSVNSYYRGTLVITIAPFGSEDPSWTGWTTQKVKNQGNVKGKIKKAVKRILRQFPPGP